MSHLESSKLSERIDQIKTQGYTVIDNLFSQEECAHFRDLLEQDSEKYGPLHARVKSSTSHSLQDKREEKVVYNMHNKHPDYMKLFVQPEVLEVVGAMLKEGYNT